MPTNIEFKARTKDLHNAEIKLKELNPTFIGTDYQKDTYYNVNVGRLKLREGNIENALIYYTRENISAVKQSNILLYKHQPSNELKQILETTNGIKIIVEKKRKIYFVQNVKIHFDEIPNFGNFIEVEAIDNDGTNDVLALQKQCNFYVDFFGIEKEDFEALSYSDLLLQQ